MYEQQTKLSFESVEGTSSQESIFMWNQIFCIQNFNKQLIELSFFFNFVFAEFQEAFNLFDNRGDGKIQQQQIGECLRALGQNPTESDVKKFTHQLKPDERISFEVFLPIYQVRCQLHVYLVKSRFSYEIISFAGNFQTTLW